MAFFLLVPLRRLHLPLEPSVRLDLHAGHVRVLLRDEEGDDGRDVANLASAAHRKAVRHLLPVMLPPEIVVVKKTRKKYFPRPS